MACEFTHYYFHLYHKPVYSLQDVFIYQLNIVFIDIKEKALVELES